MRQIILPNHQKIFAVDKLTAIDVYKEIYEEYIYFRAGIELKPKAVIIDAGANIGLFSRYVLEKVPDAKIVMFEPIPAIFDVLKANLQESMKESQNSNLIFYNIGLSDHAGTAEFYYYPRVCADSTATPWELNTKVQLYLNAMRKGGKRLIPKKLLSWIIRKSLQYLYQAEKITCPLSTLSHYIALNHIDRIDLLKLDAENAEREVLGGINDADWDKISQISMEVHTHIPGGENLIEELSQLLKAKGFNVEIDLNSRFSDQGVHMIYAKK